MIEIEPYRRVGSVTFGMSPTEASTKLGEPVATTSNRAGDVVHRYDGMLLTFDSGGLAEVGLLPESDPRVAAISPFSTDGFAKLVAEDGDARELLGFIVLLKFGLTITGMHDGDASQLAATAFRKGRWDQFLSSGTPQRSR